MDRSCDAQLFVSFQSKCIDEKFYFIVFFYTRESWGVGTSALLQLLAFTREVSGIVEICTSEARSSLVSVLYQPPRGSSP